MEELTLERIFELEPDAQTEIDRIVKRVNEYDTVWHAYSACKKAVENMVGWDADRPELRTGRAYDLAIGYIVDKLQI